MKPTLNETQIAEIKSIIRSELVPRNFQITEATISADGSRLEISVLNNTVIPRQAARLEVQYTSADSYGPSKSRFRLVAGEVAFENGQATIVNKMEVPGVVQEWTGGYRYKSVTELPLTSAFRGQLTAMRRQIISRFEQLTEQRLAKARAEKRKADRQALETRRDEALKRCREQLVLDERSGKFLLSRHSDIRGRFRKWTSDPTTVPTKTTELKLWLSEVQAMQRLVDALIADQAA